MRIRAAVVEEPGTPFVIQDLELEEPQAAEILVRIVAAGVCQTDAHVQHQRIRAPLPMVLGHEGAGVVERVGGGVTSVKRGDHVVLTFDSCGRCRHCRGGAPAYCEAHYPVNFLGVRNDGSNAIHRLPGDSRAMIRDRFFGQSSFATYAVSAERNTVAVPRDLPLEQLVSLGCGLQTGAGAVLNSLALRPGSSIAIFGTGTVGLAAVMAARIAGANLVIGVDVRDNRLALAGELGATHTVNGTTHDVESEIRRLTQHGVDAVIDLTGRPEMVELGLRVAAPRGSVVLIGAPPSFDAVATVRTAPFGSGLSLRGVVQGDSVPHVFIPQLISLFREGLFPLDRLATYYDFDDINTAFADAQRGDTVKPILRIGSPDLAS
jgi:aryl-alcohol dehydrogenase